MGGKGSCPCCKKWVDLTEHHDKSLQVKIMICRSCHNVVEEYIKVQEKTAKSQMLS